MRYFVSYSLCLLIGFYSSSGVSAQNKKDKSPDVTVLTTTPQDYEALAKYTGVTAKILAVNPTSRTITIRVEYQVPELVAKIGQGTAPKQKNPKENPKKDNPPDKKKDKKFNEQLQKLKNQLETIKKIQNPKNRHQKLEQFVKNIQNPQLRHEIQQMNWVRQQYKQMGKNLKNPPPPIVIKPPPIIVAPAPPQYKLVTRAKDFTVDVARDVRVAKKELGIEYDAKGNIKEYTQAELDKLRDSLLPGFKGKFEEVLAGQTAYIHFKKLTAKVTIDPPKKDEPKPPDNKEGASAQETKEKPEPVATTPQEKDPKEGTPDIAKAVGGTPPRPANGPVVYGILILSEPSGLNSPTLPKKKKNR